MTRTPATDHWNRLESLFQEATELPRAEHDSFIRRSCNGSAELEERLRHMLALDQSQGVLDGPPTSSMSSMNPDDVGASSLVGQRIGRFELVLLIASGGMGTVYEARQDHPRRRVALKVMNGSALTFSRTALRRFESEADILGRLQHPAIAQVYEAGVFDAERPGAAGQPYFAMELIDGLPITKFAEERGLGTRERLELMRKVCEAVDYAHSQGVIHRDLKPANIFVDGSGQPKILDFGIARIMGTGADRGTTLRTDVGQLLGTISYMSPEQVAGDPSQIDARCDVYSLGVVAYELLTGRLPHDVQSRPLPEAVRMILDEEPTPLSSILRIFRGDLDTIIGKALEKDRTRRYATARELADDIGRYLADQAVLARRPSTLYQLRKFARRNKVLVAGVLGIVGALSIGVIGTSVGLVRAKQAAKEQERLRLIADNHAERAAEAEKAAKRRLDESIKLLTELANAYDALSDVPGATKAREALALQTIRHLPQGAEDGASEFAAVAAYAYQRLGEAQLVMGRFDEALRSHQRSLLIRQAHAEHQPGSIDALRSMAVGHWKVAEGLGALGRLEESKSNYASSLGILEQVLAIDRANPQIPHYFGAAYRRIAEIELEQGLYNHAKQNLFESLKHFDEQLAITPENLPTRQGKAMTWRGLSQTALTLGQTGEALEALNTSLAIIEELSRESGQSNVFARTQEALGLLTMSRVRRAMGESEQAVAAAKRACAIADALALADPDHFESQRLAQRCHAALDDLNQSQPLGQTRNE